MGSPERRGQRLDGRLVRIARALGATVVVAEQRGSGAACAVGLQAATASVVAVMDADASLDLVEVARLVDAHRGAGHLVVGRRTPRGRGALPWYLRGANRVVAHRLNRRTGLQIRDIGPMRLARREDLLARDFAERSSGPFESVVRAAEAGWPVTQVRSPMRPGSVDRRSLARVSARRGRSAT